MNHLLKKIKEGYLPAREELLPLLMDDFEEELYKAADETRKETVGDIVHIRAILEFSNICRCRCRYCGLNFDNKKAHRYRMEVSEIIETVLEGSEAGYKTIVLQSGEDPWYTTERVCEIIKGIKNKSGIDITLSIGERSYEELKALKRRAQTGIF